MRQRTIDHYVRMADRAEYGYQTYGGDAQIASLRCFRAYHPQARMTWMDVNGRQRWMTATMMRIHAVLARESMRPNGDLVRVRDMAREARTSPGYFSKVLERFTAWGMFASISIRGRTGGIYLWARTAGDTFERYAQDARAWITVRKELAAARFIRKHLNVSTYTNESTGEDTEETFKGWKDGVQGYIRAASDLVEGMAGNRRSRGRERGGAPAH